MTTTTIHTFATDDQRARFTWNDVPMRAVRIDRDEDGDLSVWVVQLTRRGTDFKRNGYMWLTLQWSLERFPTAGGVELAAYVRELAAAAAS